MFSLTEEKQEQIIELARELIKIPSQAGIDSSEGIFKFLNDWLGIRGLESKLLVNNRAEKLGLLITIPGRESQETYCLNACIDTAPFGNLLAWKTPPNSGEIIDGWLYGRGSADSKIAVAIFSYIALLLKEQERPRTNIHFLFDGDEHTGRFGGIKAYLEINPDVDGFMIGYPGERGVNIGARGFHRVQITVYGTSKHSGSTKKNKENAIEKTVNLVQKLVKIQLPKEKDVLFGLNPQLTVTGINGGHSYSIIPDICKIYLDIRLTPSFQKEQAEELVKFLIKNNDLEFPTSTPTSFTTEESWPSYMLSENSKVKTALIKAASIIKQTPVPGLVCGPSNIGNYLATMGIDATCGYGVRYKNIHAANESVEIASIKTTFETYLEAIKLLQIQEK